MYYNAKEKIGDGYYIQTAETRFTIYTVFVATTVFPGFLDFV